MTEKGFNIQEVKSFYDRIGWQVTEDGVYQNARFEDLRPVSREYIHKCHLRINRYLAHKGKYLLDAGSGPIQYPEYLTYSEGYTYRVCLDLSLVALLNARERIGNKGLFVVGDVAHLPFAPGVFDDAVSLHTFHHLPLEGTRSAFREMLRVLKLNATAVVVNGWSYSPLMKSMSWIMRVGERFDKGKNGTQRKESRDEDKPKNCDAKPAGTFVEKFDAEKLKKEILPGYNFQIRVWRSVSVRFLRAVVRPDWRGKLLLKIIYELEEMFPTYFGEKGQYPMIILKKEEGMR